MKGHLTSIGAMALTMLSASCASTSLTVEPASAGANSVHGVRYSLPKMFLLVKPSPTGDGTFTVETVFLPNEEQTYAISGKTKRGKYSLDVETKDGLLKKIAWSAAGTTDVTAGAVKSAGDLAKAVVDKREADRKEAESDAEADTKALRAAEKEARSLVETKTLELKLAELELASAKAAVVNPQSPTTAEKGAIREAQLKRDKAAAALEDARSRLLLRQAALARGGTSSANEPTERSSKSHETFWGPVLYEIRDDGKTVDIVTVKWNTAMQKQLETVTAHPPVEGETSQAITNTVKVTGVKRAGPDAVITLEAARAVKTIDADQLNLFKPGTPLLSIHATAVIAADKKTITVTIASLAKGDYTLQVIGTNEDGTHLQTPELSVAVP
jgi:hypothetical protein